MSQPTVHSFHVTFYTTKFHFNRDMDNALKFAVMKTELYAIILAIFIYITHVHLFCLFSKAVLETIRGTSTVPPSGYSVTIRVNHPLPTIWKAKKRKEKPKQQKKKKQTTNRYA